MPPPPGVVMALAPREGQRAGTGLDETARAGDRPAVGGMSAAFVTVSVPSLRVTPPAEPERAATATLPGPDGGEAAGAAGGQGVGAMRGPAAAAAEVFGSCRGSSWRRPAPPSPASVRNRASVLARWRGRRCRQKGRCLWCPRRSATGETLPSPCPRHRSRCCGRSPTAAAADGRRAFVTARPPPEPEAAGVRSAWGVGDHAAGRRPTSTATCPLVSPRLPVKAANRCHRCRGRSTTAVAHGTRILDRQEAAASSCWPGWPASTRIWLPIATPVPSRRSPPVVVHVAGAQGRVRAGHDHAVVVGVAGRRRRCCPRASGPPPSCTIPPSPEIRLMTDMVLRLKASGACQRRESAPQRYPPTRLRRTGADLERAGGDGS